MEEFLMSGDAKWVMRIVWAAIGLSILGLLKQVLEIGVGGFIRKQTKNGEVPTIERRRSGDSQLMTYVEQFWKAANANSELLTRMIEQQMMVSQNLRDLTFKNDQQHDQIRALLSELKSNSHG